MRVCFGVLFRHTEIQFARDEDESFVRDLEMADGVVLLRIEDLFLVHGEIFSEVDVVTVGAKIAAVEGRDDDGAVLHLLEDLRVG